jgi:hypothetical protein
MAPEFTSQAYELALSQQDVQQQQLAVGASRSAATCDNDMVDDYALDKTFHQKGRCKRLSNFLGLGASLPRNGSSLKIPGLANGPWVSKRGGLEKEAAAKFDPCVRWTHRDPSMPTSELRRSGFSPTERGEAVNHALPLKVGACANHNL